MLYIFTFFLLFTCAASHTADSEIDLSVDDRTIGDLSEGDELSNVTPRRVLIVQANEHSNLSPLQSRNAQLISLTVQGPRLRSLGYASAHPMPGIQGALPSEK